MESANVTIFGTRKGPFSHKKFRKQNMQTNHFNSNTSQNESAQYKKKTSTPFFAKDFSDRARSNQREHPQ